MPLSLSFSFPVITLLHRHVILSVVVLMIPANYQDLEIVDQSRPSVLLTINPMSNVPTPHMYTYYARRGEAETPHSHAHLRQRFMIILQTSFGELLFCLQRLLHFPFFSVIPLAHTLTNFALA
jgi:hypothetical protein